ncbi:MAG: hypothetical protein IJ630_06910 [Treponema sp.]|nr:hypothetical protein [Treponema sp.]
MKNKILASCVLFIALCGSLSAKSKYTDIPGNNEVTVVGRLNFSTDADRDFLFETFEVPEDKRHYPDIYVLPYIPGSAGLFTNVHKAKEITKFEEQAWGVNGGYFFVQYKLLKDRTLYFSSITLFLNGSYMLPVKLPLGFKVRVPEKEKFLYLGDFTFKAKGFAFEISASVKDNYDDAQAVLDKVTKKDYDLCRASLEKITEEDLEAIKKTFYYESAGYSFKDWYKSIDELIAKDEELKASDSDQEL